MLLLWKCKIAKGPAGLLIRAGHDIIMQHSERTHHSLIIASLPWLLSTRRRTSWSDTFKHNPLEGSKTTKERIFFTTHFSVSFAPVEFVTHGMLQDYEHVKETLYLCLYSLSVANTSE